MKQPAGRADEESFNGQFREESSHAHWFESLEDARANIDAWRWGYNENRPSPNSGWSEASPQVRGTK